MAKDTPPAALDETRALIRDALELMARGQCVAFAQIWNVSGTAIGSTRFLDIRPKDRQIEIGSPRLLADAGEHRGEVPAPPALLRVAGLRPGGAQDGRP